MQEIKPPRPLLNIPFKTLIPGFVGITLLTLSKRSEFDPQLSQRNPALSSTISESYYSYFVFMLVVLFIKVLLEGLKLLPFCNKENTNETFSLKDNSKGHSRSARHMLVSLTKSILLYSLIYCTYQVTLFSPISDSLVQAPQNQQLHLLQEFSSDDYNKPISSSLPHHKPSLSIGRVLSEVDLEGYRMILSKDQKTAFVVGHWGSLFLTIIDLSDLEFPIILSSYQVSQGLGYYNIIPQAMILSEDETKLYISNSDSLEIIDISNQRSPSTLSITKDINAGKRTKTSGQRQVEVDWPSVLFSKDRQFLFAAGLGLQVFNISKPDAPISVSSVESPISKWLLIPTSIALSPDGKTLYYTDGSLWIYDISDPMNLKLLNSFNTSFIISSMRLLKDGKTAYLAGRNSKNQLLLQKISLSDVKEDQVIVLEKQVGARPVFLEQAPNDTFLFIKVDYGTVGKDSNVVVFDTHEERMISHEKMFTNNAHSILFSEDYQRMFFIAPNRKVGIVNLYPSFPNKNSFSRSRNILQQFEPKKKFTSMTFTNETFFYGIDSSSKGSVSTLSAQQILPEFDDLLAYSVLYQINFPIKMTLSPDNTKAYLIINSKIASILDLSDPLNVTSLGEYRPDEISFVELNYFIASKDGKTGYLSYKYENRLSGALYNLVHIVNLSNPAEPVKMASIQVDQDTGRLILSKDEKTLFIGGKMLSIYDVARAESPVLLANFALSASSLSQGNTEMLVSQDEKILYMKIERTSSPIIIQAIDITNLTSPKPLSEFRFPSGTTNSFGMTLSPDSKTIYLMREDVLLAIDVSKPSSLRYAGAIMIMEENSRDYVTDFKFIKDGRKAFLATAQGVVQVIAIQPAYSTYFLQDTLLLGERYTIDLMMLEMDKNLDYNKMAEAYKFTKFLFVDPPSNQNSAFILKTPPSWITFDFKSHSLTVEARRKSDIKTFTAYFSFSKKVPETVFDDYGLELPTKSQDLIASLISLGYLDNQLFLTENFGDPEDFYLSSNYSNLKDEIFAILKQYSFETFNELHIVQSLNLTYEKRLKISTTNPASLKVDISLKPGEGQFLSRHYGSLLPTITSNKSRIILEGSLADVNLALQEVVLNLENNLTSCDGQITIDDNLNPLMTESIQDIPKYLKINNKPKMSETFPETLQHQVDRHRVETGQYFQIKFDQNAFHDDYTAVENLKYSVTLINKAGSESVLPDWLAFRDMTLSGTAPEAIFDRDFSLKIIVKNEFQQFKEPFTLHVKISSAFVLKLLMKYSPYLLSVLTLIISMNRIYNILGKRWYQHPIDYYLKPGEEVTSQIIFPIFLIAQEIKEAKKISRHLERVTTKESFSYDKQRFIEKARDCLIGLPKKEKSSLRLYFQGSTSQKMTINQLIIDDFIIKLLKSNEQRETKVYYEKIKKDWSMCVEWDSKNSFFKINNKKFDNLLTLRNPQPLIKNDEAPLLDDRLQQVNMELLKDAILSYAFECQSLNKYPQDIQVHAKERKESDFIRRFLKMDLKDCAYSGSGKIGYGIESKKKFGTIYFCGVVEEDFLNKTIVFQIINSKHKILKELWIYSADIDEEQLVEGDDQREQAFYSLSELEARGKEYEAF